MYNLVQNLTTIIKFNKAIVLKFLKLKVQKLKY